jgi:hypothetical protein
LLKILSKMNNFFYIYWDWSNRLLFISSWHLIILITSRDRNHITWFWRNSASVSLFATLSHRTWIAKDFFLISNFSKAIEILRLHFLKFFYKRKFFFLTHLLYAKSTFNNDRKLYKKKWCDLMRIWLFSSHWNLNCTLWNLSYKRKNFFLTRSVYARTTLSVDRKLYKKRFCNLMRTWLFSFHKSLSRNVLTIQFLKQRETERICLWSVIWLDRQLSFDRWARKTCRKQRYRSRIAGSRDVTTVTWSD